MSNTNVDEEIASLRLLVEDQQRRLASLEDHSEKSNGHGTSHSRRDLLRLAGAGLVGAAGAAAFSVIPAAAATGGNFLLGSGNQADAQTLLQLTADKPSGGGVNNNYA